MLDNNAMKEYVLTRIQDRLRRFVGANQDIEKLFTEWYHGLLAGASILPPPPPPGAEGGGPPPDENGLPDLSQMGATSG